MAESGGTSAGVATKLKTHTLEGRGSLSVTSDCWLTTFVEAQPAAVKTIHRIQTKAALGRAPGAVSGFTAGRDENLEFIMSSLGAIPAHCRLARGRSRASPNATVTFIGQRSLLDLSHMTPLWPVLPANTAPVSS